MKRLLLVFIISLTFIGLFAQSESYSFYYIAHDRETPVGTLTRKLQEVYNSALEYGNAVTFYLPNSSEPIVVSVNTKDENHQDFPNIIRELQEKVSNEIYPDMDIEQIVNYLIKNPIVDENDQLKYNEVSFNFYVTPLFWTMNFNESVISSLYWTLDMKKLTSEKEVYMYVFSPKNNPVSNEEYPFGVKNLEGIEQKLELLTY